MIRAHPKVLEFNSNFVRHVVEDAPSPSPLPSASSPASENLLAAAPGGVIVLPDEDEKHVPTEEDGEDGSGGICDTNAPPLSPIDLTS